MNRVIRSLAVLAIAGAALPAAAEAAPKRGANAAAASVPFVAFGGIRNWTAKDDSTLYVEGTGNRWYEVDLAIPCFNLSSALRIGIDTGGFDRLDNFSNIIVDGQRCPVASVTEIAGPPPRRASVKK